MSAMFFFNNNIATFQFDVKQRNFKRPFMQLLWHILLCTWKHSVTFNISNQKKKKTPKNLPLCYNQYLAVINFDCKNMSFLITNKPLWLFIPTYGFCWDTICSILYFITQNSVKKINKVYKQMPCPE